MKTIIVIVCLLGTIFLRLSHDVKAFRAQSQNKQRQLDSLKVVMHDLQKDTVVCKMLTDIGYRTKMMTLIKVLPEQEIVKLVNKYKKPLPQKVKTTKRVKTFARQKTKQVVLS